MGQNDSVIRVDLTDAWWKKALSTIAGIVAGIVAIIVIVAATVFTAGVAGAVIETTVTAAIGTGAVLIATSVGVVSGVAFYNTQFPDDLILPIYSISPEEIFKGNILLFDVDFFNPVQDIYVKLDDGTSLNMSNYTTDDKLKNAIGDRDIQYYYYNKNGQEIKTSKQNSAKELQKLISQWYNALRNMAIVLSMSVLLYIGIRMLLTTVAQDKAKYKQMLTDWFIGLCLIFFLHYIMATSVTVVKNFTNTLSITNLTQKQQQKYATTYSAVLQLENKKLKKKIEDLGSQYKDLIQKAKDSDGKETEWLMWPTNLMGQLRVQAEMSYGDSSFIGYGLCFFTLTLYTVFFVFTYLKRLLYMAFLTIIAPLVALTYPIDKINDGQAQGFNKWLREYLFNLLIQPLHLLIYTILVTSAFELAGKNVLYSLAAIGFLIPAEKIMRGLFGFEKAHTPPSMAGAAIGASMFNQGLQKILKPSLPGKNGKGNNKGKIGEEEVSKAPRMGYKGDDTVDAVGELIGGDSENPIPMGEQTPDNGSDYNPANDRAYNSMLDNPNTPQATNIDEPNESDQLSDYSLLGMAGRGIYNSKVGTPLRGAVSAGKWAGRKVDSAKQVAGRGVRKIGNSPVGKLGKFVGNSREGKFVKYYAKQGVRAARNTVGNAIASAPNVAVKAATGALLGVAAGAVGVGAGLASGDIGNAAKWGLGAAATAGAVGASRVSIETGGAERTAAQIARGKAIYGDKYEEREAKRNIQNWKKDYKNKEAIEQELGKDRTKQLYTNGDIDTYLKNEVTDVKDIVALENLRKQSADNMSASKAVAINSKKDQIGEDPSKMTTKKRKEWKETFAKDFKDRGVSDSRAKEGSDKLMKDVSTLYKIRKKL